MPSRLSTSKAKSELCPAPSGCRELLTKSARSSLEWTTPSVPKPLNSTWEREGGCAAQGSAASDAANIHTVTVARFMPIVEYRLSASRPGKVLHAGDCTRRVSAHVGGRQQVRRGFRPAIAQRGGRTSCT